MADQIVRRNPNTVTRDSSEGVKPAAAAPAADTEEIGVIKALGRLLKKHTSADGDAQDHALGGQVRAKTVMDAVDEAVTGAKGANPDY